VTDGAIGFGGIGYHRSAYLDDQHLAALNAEDPAIAGNINGNVGVITDSSQPSGFRSFLVSHNIVGTSGLALPEGASFCTCQYLQWGYWESQFNWDAPDTPDAGRSESFHIGTWVGGDLANAGQINGLVGQGEATFNGHVIANVYNAVDGPGSQYLAAGAFTDVWDFNSRTGTVTITGLDGRNYASAPGGIVNSGANFTGSFSATDASGITGTLNGSFFNSPALVAAYQGGSLTGHNVASTYRFAGTFAAQR